MATRLRGMLMLAGMVALTLSGTAVAAGTITLGTPEPTPKGTAFLTATFSGPGTATLHDASSQLACGPAPRIRSVTVDVQANQAVRFAVKPTTAIRPALREGRKVKVPVAVTLQPQGQGTPAVTEIARVLLRLKATSQAVAHRCVTPPPQH